MTSSRELLAGLSPEKRALLALRLVQKRKLADDAAPPQMSIVPDPNRRFDPFPLTDLQQAYWVGRMGAFDMGRIASHCYIEIEGQDLDMARLEDALCRVVDRHDMLRAFVLPDGQQQVLEEVPRYEITTLDIRGKAGREVEERLAAVRNEMSHQILPTDKWPLFDIRAARLDDGRVRLFVSLDAIVVDAWSILLLFTEWAQFYHTRDSTLAPVELSFRDCVLAEQSQAESPRYRVAREYWQDRLSSLPAAPVLPLARPAKSLVAPRFVRRHFRLERGVWDRLKQRARRAGLTEAGVLLAAYAEVLGLWGAGRRFALSVPEFNRPPHHPNINDVIGEFASFTVLEIDNRGNDSFEVRARRHQAQLWQDLDHRMFSGVAVLREYAKQRRDTTTALMPVVFTNLTRQERDGSATLSEAVSGFGNVVYAINQSSQVWLDNHVYEIEGGLACDWDSVDELYPQEMPAAMLEGYERLLRLLAENEMVWQAQWSAMSDQIRSPNERALRAKVNGITEPITAVRAQDLFLRKAAERPGSLAVIAAGKRITYGELVTQANRLGQHLRNLGARPDQPVAIVMEKGWEQVVAVLGTLQAGAPYLPIDPDQPLDRLHRLLEIGEADLILTQSWLAAKHRWPEAACVVPVDTEALSHVPGDPPVPVQGSDDLAYVLFTSGSTGTPKGVMVAHRGLVNAIEATKRVFEIGRDDRVLALTALHHDMSAFDILCVLGAGGVVVVPEHGGRRDPAHWADLIRREHVTLWNSVPAMMEMMLEYAEERSDAELPSIRLVFLGGDWISLSLPDRLRRLSHRARLVSVGGPTETTLWNIWYTVSEVDPEWKSIPYGHPIANTKYYVLNDALEECPTWVSGEMCCAGVGVARGYWRDSEKTEEKFVTLPRTGERIYRTGDIGRYRADGNLEILGRLDLQIKMHGHRIEPGEIEAILRTHPAVRDAVVGVVGEANNKQTLLGYVIAADGQPPSQADLRDFLDLKLPQEMIPRSFVTLDRFPMTPNGKIDRRALIASVTPPAEATTAGSGGPGLSDTVIMIAELVGNVLDVESVDPTVNVLTYGANSIDMVRIGNRLEKIFGSRLRIDQLFRLQTVAALAAHYDKQTEKSPSQEASSSPQPPDDVATLVASYQVIVEPAEREAFKKAQHGIRQDLCDRRSVALSRPETWLAFEGDYQTRRSHRRYSLRPILFNDFGRFLSCLAQSTLNGEPKYLYASPGGLYPTQVYVHVKAGRVDGVGGGTYYYHPIEHALVELTPDAVLERKMHIPFINTPTFDEAGFSLFLVAQLGAVAPSYGEASVRLVTLEAGIIAHMLETSAARFGIGLCQIGSIDFDAVRSLLQLERSHILIHSLVGGAVDEHTQPSKSEATDAAGAPEVSRLLGRIKDLSDVQTRALLAANRPTPKDGRS